MYTVYFHPLLAHTFESNQIALLLLSSMDQGAKCHLTIQCDRLLTDVLETFGNASKNVCVHSVAEYNVLQLNGNTVV